VDPLVGDTEVEFSGIGDPYRYQKLIEVRHRLEAQGLKAAWSDTHYPHSIPDGQL